MRICKHVCLRMRKEAGGGHLGIKVAEMKLTPHGSGAVLEDVSALAAGLERLVLEFDKLRRSALRDVHLNPEAAYLLRLAAQPGGVRLGLFRERLAITEPRASQIVRPLEATHLVEKSRDAGNARARTVRTTDKGCRTLAKFDVQLAEALRAELANGDASSLQAGIAAIRLAATPAAQAAEGHEDRKPSRTGKSAKSKQAGVDRPGFWNADGNPQ